MELALYCPQLGFYERKSDTVGAGGDFYTSVSTGRLFGELLAFQFARWLEAAEATSEVRLLEAGAHNGRLAGDILSWVKTHRPQLAKRLKYVLIEPSEVRQAWQQEQLREFSGQVQWRKDFTPQSGDDSPGIFFSNELFDSLPVHRFGWDAAARQWFEWGVGVEGEAFVWRKLPATGELPVVDAEITAVLPDGYRAETCPAATRLYEAAAGLVPHGKLVTIDYGDVAGEEFQPGRMGGTLRAYHQHRVSSELLANVGEQDLTAQVSFPALQAAGARAGLRTELLATQAQFFTAVAAQVWQAPEVFGEWTSAHTRQFQTLTHPEHLGRAFRVLVQTR